MNTLRCMLAMAIRSVGDWGILVLAACCIYEASGIACAENTSEEVSIVFGGDVMLDGGPGHAIQNGVDPFADVAFFLQDADLAICNLECVLADGGQQVLKAYTFRGGEESIPLLKRYFSAVCLANNHTGDFGKEAFHNQLAMLDKADISYFGGGADRKQARKPLVFDCKGRRIALLGYNDFPPREFEAGEHEPGTAWLVDSDVIADVQAARKQDRADIVILFLHWGEELEPEPTQEQQALAHRLIDAGADAIVGGHPHVVQPIETYKERPIIYSLGNFVFDYFPDDPPIWTGWLAKLHLANSGGIRVEKMEFQIDPVGIPHPIEKNSP